MGKLISLQYVRGIASISVLLTHVLQFLEIKPFGYTMSGQYGVDVFFILSGFVIFYTLKDNENFDSFMIKRICRIFPLYLLVLLLTYLYKVFTGCVYNLDVLIQNVFMFPYTKEIGYKSLIVVQAWSLVFEMYFYIIMALTILFFRKKSYIIPFIISVGVIAGILKIINPYNLMQISVLRYLISVASSSHIIKFVIGVIIAWLYRRYYNQINNCNMNNILTKITFIIIRDSRETPENNLKNRLII